MSDDIWTCKLCDREHDEEDSVALCDGCAREGCFDCVIDGMCEFCVEDEEDDDDEL